MKVLIVDDEPSIVNLIRMNLKLEGYDSVCAYSGREAVEAYAAQKPDIVLLDIMLPDMDGDDVLRAIQELDRSAAVIFITANDKRTSKILGLELGADDYIIKPFLPKELLFRVNAILRRSYKGENPLVRLSGSEIDFDRAQVLKNGEYIPLTAKEHSILAALYRNAGRIVTIDALCEAAWGDNPFGYENSLMAHIRRIREKIESDPSHPVSLITIKGLGYKLVTEGR